MLNDNREKFSRRSCERSSTKTRTRTSRSRVTFSSGRLMSGGDKKVISSSRYSLGQNLKAD